MKKILWHRTKYIQTVRTVEVSIHIRVYKWRDVKDGYVIDRVFTMFMLSPLKYHILYVLQKQRANKVSKDSHNKSSI